MTAATNEVGGESNVRLSASGPLLPPPVTTSPSELSYSYSEASTFFLTRRLREAFILLETIVFASSPYDEASPEVDLCEPASIANASKSLRIKIWCLYITVLDAIIKLGPEQGRAIFGQQKWRTVVARVRDSNVSEDVVQSGYGGVEERVDIEVVVNLATLLLTHASSQKSNQLLLERYIASSAAKGLATTTAREAGARVTILEIYALHVLPRNGEWDLAREVITAPDTLNDDQRRLFLQTLESLHKEKLLEVDPKANRKRDIGRPEEDQEQTTHRLVNGSSVGADGVPRVKGEATQKTTSRRLDHRPEPSLDSPTRSTTALSNGVSAGPRGREKRASQRGRLQKSAKGPTPVSGVYQRSLGIVGLFQKYVLMFTETMRTNPLILLRTVLFLIGILFTLGRGEFRDRLKRITATGWDKVRGTIGMGVKVSYV